MGPQASQRPNPNLVDGINWENQSCENHDSNSCAFHELTGCLKAKTSSHGGIFRLKVSNQFGEDEHNVTAGYNGNVRPYSPMPPVHITTNTPYATAKITKELQDQKVFICLVCACHLHQHCIVTIWNWSFFLDAYQHRHTSGSVTSNSWSCHSHHSPLSYQETSKGYTRYGWKAHNVKRPPTIPCIPQYPIDCSWKATTLVTRATDWSIMFYRSAEGESRVQRPWGCTTKHDGESKLPHNIE